MRTGAYPNSTKLPGNKFCSFANPSVAVSLQGFLPVDKIIVFMQANFPDTDVRHYKPRRAFIVTTNS